MLAFTDHDLDGLAQTLVGWGFKPSLAKRLVRDYYDATGRLAWVDLNPNVYPRALRAKLAEELAPRQSSITHRHDSADGTVKLLIQLAGGGAVESVLMPGYRDDRAAACVSSQIGCAMGCDFCASTRGGLERSLSAGEITEQFLHLRELSQTLGRRLTSLVFMGMGEPLANYDATVAAVRRIADPQMGALGWRQVTVSTVGIVPAMDRLAEEDLNIHLALSLHAPDDPTRARLVPPNRKWNVAEVMAAARRFAGRTGRVPTIEYCLLAGVNDSDLQAQQLAALMDGFRAHVNLIPYNWIGQGLSGTVYFPSAPQRVDAFVGILRDAGVAAHVRRQRGDDVNAACGQLRGEAGNHGDA